jgi:hypothetical protein
MASPPVSRRRVLSTVGLLAIGAASGASVYAATVARTPGQRWAASAPPVRSEITAAVSTEPLVDAVTVDGTLTRAVVVPIVASAAPASGQRAVVTGRPVRPGDQVRPGTVAVEISGRPIFVLMGRFGAYRDLYDGDVGPDVRQLQRALRPLYGTPVTGRLDARTGRHIEALYTRAGYPTPAVRVPGPDGAGPGRRLRLPAAEVAYVAALPATVHDVRVRVGDPGLGHVLTVGGGDWQVVAAVDAWTGPGLVERSSRVTFAAGPLRGRTGRLLAVRDRPAAPTTDEPVSGAVAGAAEPPAPDSGAGPVQEPGPDGSTREAVFAVSGRVRTGAGLVGSSQRVTVERGRSPRGAATVPAAALWTGADGAVAVTVRHGRSLRRVPVEVVLSVGGQVAVRSQDGTELAGSEVLLGHEAAG